MKKIKIAMAALLAGFIGITTACDDNDNDGSPAAGESRVRISMTDAPGDYDEVNVEVIGVRYKTTNDNGENGWIDMANVNAGVYNLLDLTGGVTVMLTEDDIPAGHLGQIRLILGDDNTVVKDGVTHPLNTPSAQQSGLKLNINQTLEPNTVYNFLVDFDVHHSVVQAGNSGNYNLHPVLRVTAQAASGSIGGTILNLGIPVEASVVVGGSTVTANTNAQGEFVIHGVPSGTYDVTLTPSLNSGLNIMTIHDVTVVKGQMTSIGSVTLL
jgi:hypothetical protein